MNKTVLIAVIIVILLALLGGAYFMMSKNKSGISTTSDNQESSTSVTQSIKDLITSGLPQRCTYTDVVDEMNVNGTIYTAGGKVRAEFTSTVEGKTTTGHMIYDNSTSYIWTDDTNTGFKAMVDLDTVDEEATEEGLDFEKPIDYNCSAWVPDPSMFTPPSSISFTEFNLPETDTGTTATQNPCDSCNFLTGDEKTQCLSALNCN